MSNSDLRVVILAGGQGARFWPISRRERPKQFLSISASGESLIQATARRVAKLAPPGGLWVVTNHLHKALISKHVPSARILSEPLGRNTAASIGLAAIYARRENPKAVMIVLPADHVVSNETRLLQVLNDAAQIAAVESLLVTIGVEPSFPNTAYGYIHRGAKLVSGGYTVRRFFEKPSLERATKYCESGEFYWNSGMFVWRVDVILDAIEDHLPQLFEGLNEIDAVIGTAAEQETIARIFEKLEPISIDFGVLEHARNCGLVIANEFGWNDVGSWDAWAEHFKKDAFGNHLDGDALVIDSSSSVVCAKDRFIAVLGVENLIVIDSGDALLVCPRERVQDVRKIVDELKARGREELI